MKEESHYPGIVPELEARIVALVLGEASDVERDQLNRLIEERPELRAFTEQIQCVHGLLQDVGTGETVAENDEWKLSAERRSAVVAVMSGEAKEQPAIPFVNKSVEKQRSVTGNLLWNLTKIAAVFCVVGFFASIAMPTIFNRGLTDSATMKQLGLAMHDYDATASTSERNGPDALGGTRLRYRFDDANAIAAEDKRLAEPAAVTEFDDYAKSSKSALLAIRDSLDADAALPSPYYLQDDVQYFPAGPEFKLPRGAAELREDGAAEKQNHDGQQLGIDGESLDDVSRRVVASGASDRPVLEAESVSFADDAAKALDSQDSGQGQGTSQGQPQRRGGTGLRFAEEMNSSPAGGKGIVIDGVADSGQTFGGGGFGGGTDIRDGNWDFDTKISDPARVASALPSPTNEPIASRDHFKRETESATAMNESRGELQVGQGKQDDRWGATENAKREFGVRGEEVGQPDTTTRADVPHEMQRQVAESLAELSTLNDFSMNLDPDENVLADGEGKSVDQGWERDQSKRRDDQRELLPQRGQPAIEGESLWYEYVPPMLDDKSDSKDKSAVMKSAAAAGLHEQAAEDEAFSTFSLHVSDVSFKLAQSALAQGEWPEAAKVRIEEFVNAFDYGDPMPGQNEKVACRVEQSIHPFLQQRNLLRVSMRTAAAGRSSNTPLRLTFLLDNSGSMERIDRQQTVRRAFALLAQQLKPIDQVTLISFARQPRLLADKVSGAQSHQLVQLIDDLPSEGGTNIEAALQLGFEKAQEQQVDGAQNRIILLTDGAVNLGDADPESLSRMITTMRDAGIAFDAAGISADGLNDEILEALTRKGDGRYYLLDSLESADHGFARQIAGALRPSAKNVKVQIEFNPKRVGRYKLLGFEKHRLKQEDFRNDAVDAAEMAAAETGVAVYQFEAKPEGEGDVGSVSVRFFDLSTGQMIEDRWPIPYEADAPRPDQAAPSLRIAMSAALLAAKLRGEPLGETVDLKTLSDLVSGLPDRDRNATRVQQLQRMIQQARQVSGN